MRVREGARYACFGDGLCCTVIRVQLFETVHAWLVADGPRPDQAAAEAILVIEVGGGTDWWQDIARKVMLSP